MQFGLMLCSLVWSCIEERGLSFLEIALNFEGEGHRRMEDMEEAG